MLSGGSSNPGCVLCPRHAPSRQRLAAARRPHVVRMSHFPEPIVGYTLEVEVGPDYQSCGTRALSSFSFLTARSAPHPLFAITRSFSLLQYAVSLTILALHLTDSDLGIAWDSELEGTHSVEAMEVARYGVPMSLIVACRGQWSHSSLGRRRNSARGVDRSRTSSTRSTSGRAPIYCTFVAAAAIPTATTACFSLWL